MKKVDTDNMDDIEAFKKIADVYYNPESGFIGEEKLYQKLKTFGITRKQIKSFLKKQELYQINKRPDTQGSFIPAYPLHEFQIDLIYLEDKHLNKASYGLCCIDVFTKKADIVLMKNKDESSTTAAMKTLLNRMGSPEMVYCDEGNEFNNTKFKKLMDDHNIELILTLRHAPVVERFNRTIKEMLSKYLQASKSKTIINVLPVLIKNYNNSYHKTIEMAPNEVNEDNLLEVYTNIWEKSNIRNREEINVGDKVRVLVKEKAYDKKYKARWSKEIHTVREKEGQFYFIDKLTRTYLRAYLLKVVDNETKDVEPLLEGTREGHLKNRTKAKIEADKIKDAKPIALRKVKRVLKRRAVLDL